MQKSQAQPIAFLSTIRYIPKMPRKPAASSSEAFSHDQAVKTLLKTYPAEALEFLAPDVFQAHGTPSQISFLDPAVARDDTAESGPGMAMDLVIRYEFGDGQGLVMFLVEHWSDSTKLDLLRTARYYVDLCRRFPGEDILPVALVDDSVERNLTGLEERGAEGEVFLRFQTRVVQVPALDLDRFRDTANRVALSFSPNMRGAFDRAEQVLRVAIAFRDRGDMNGIRTFFAFWTVEGRLDRTEQAWLLRRLKEIDMPEIMDWIKQEGIEQGLEKGLEQGRAEGLRQARLDDARKMIDRGCDWAFITDITGLRPEDLNS